MFDLHFHPREPSLLVVAGSSGCVALFKVSVVASGEETITPLWTRPAHKGSSIPALFLAWTPQDWLPQNKADGFAVTFPNGQTTVFGTDGEITAQEKIVELGTFNARETIEVWLVALATLQSGGEVQSTSKIPFLFTGDDFGSLHTRRFDVQNPNESEDDEQETLPPVILDHDDRALHHTAGITSILPLPLPLVGDAPLLLTGSYDEYLRIYHATRRGSVLTELCLGGGVWRLQMLNTEHAAQGSDSDSQEWRFLILASCMHGGTRVVKITGDGESRWEIEVLVEFTEHESMNYASDVWRGDQGEKEKESKLLCLSSSFYDCRVCIWRVDI